MKKGTVEIVNLNNSTAEIFLYGNIGDAANGVVALDFIRELKQLNETKKLIRVRINSEGGNVFEGLAIIAALKDCTVQLEGYVDSVAASMAAVVALSIPKLYMRRGSRLMTHRVKGGTFGTYDEINTVADLLDSVESDLCDLIAARTGLSREEVKREYMSDYDKWITAEQAKEAKLIAGIIETIPASSSGMAKDVLKDVYNSSKTPLKTVATLPEKFRGKSWSDLFMSGTDLYELKNEFPQEYERLRREEFGEALSNPETDRSSQERAKEALKNALNTGKINEGLYYILKADYANRPQALEALLSKLPEGDPVHIFNGKSWDDLFMSGELERVRDHFPDHYAKLQKERWGREPKSVK